MNFSKALSLSFFISISVFSPLFSAVLKSCMKEEKIKQIIGTRHAECGHAYSYEPLLSVVHKKQVAFLEDIIISHEKKERRELIDADLKHDLFVRRQNGPLIIAVFQSLSFIKSLLGL